MDDQPKHTPWMTTAEAGAYLHRGRRFVRREIQSGRLRGAVVGGRKEYLTRRDWCDQWVETLVMPVAMSTRRRVG